MEQAIILAAGEGQRLRPFTVNKPKVMLTIARKPILQYVVEALSHNGIQDILIVVGYRKEQIFDYFGNGEKFGVNISYEVQERQIGTAVALMSAKESAAEEFLVLPGDNLIDADTISDFLKMRPNSILVKSLQNTFRYGTTYIKDGKVEKIIEKPGEADQSLISTGAYIFDRTIFDNIGDSLGIPDVVNSLIERKISVIALETKGTWLDVVYPWDILTVNREILKRVPTSHGGIIEHGTIIKGAVTVGKGTVIKANSYIVGPVIIGQNCDIGPNACIFPSTSIGDNVSISAFTNIENSVIENDVTIGSGSIIEDSVIDGGCVIKGHFNACKDEVEVKINNEHHTVNIGAMLGGNCNIGNSVVAQPGVILGNCSRVRPMRLLSGIIPDGSSVY